jgi:hypothetical protein
VSYVPYTPDVCPPLDAPPPSNARRIVLWIAGTILYLFLIAAWVWWMKLPPKIQPPLATIPLKDGTELRLVNVWEGADYRAHSSDTFNDRIRVNDLGYYNAGGTNSRSGRGVWLVYSQFQPKRERFSTPRIQSFEITESGTSAVYQGLTDPSPDLTLVHDTLLFPVIPRRIPSLQVKIKLSGSEETIETTIPNPVYRPDAPTWKGESLPVTRVVEGATVAVEKITFGISTMSVNGQTTKSPSAFPSIKVTEPGAPKDSFRTAYEWSDATGNAIDRGMLPSSESVWKLKVTFTESSSYPFPPEQIHSLGKIAVPGPGQVVALTVPKKLQDLGITDALVMGPGTYQRNGKTIQLAATGGQMPKVVATTTGFSPSSIGTLASWEIHFHSRTSGGVRGKGPTLRVRHETGFIESNSHGSSSNGYAWTETWSGYRTKSGPVPAGDAIEIDMVVPKTRTAEFLINRPDPPK